MARIYLSSTVTDLRECREAVYRALRRLGHDVLALEDYAASDTRHLDRSLNDVQRCDVYIGLVAFRYGYVPPTDAQNPASKSITELEYLAARNARKPTLMFLLDDKAPWPATFLDKISGESDGGEKISRFRQNLLEDGLVTFFRTCAELGELVSVGVTRLLATEAGQSAGRDRNVTGLADTPREIGADSKERLAQYSTIFLCYRREDTQDAAGRLHDRLSAKFGSDRVFMDIDSVPLGIDFVEHVTQQIAKCSAVIVMIGKQWLKIKDKKRRRLDYEDDLLRTEIRAALQQKIPVIPVTVQNAAMPRADDLPDDIRPLARRNGIELSATRWSTDVERLVKELDRVMKSGGS